MRYRQLASGHSCSHEPLNPASVWGAEWRQIASKGWPSGFPGILPAKFSGGLHPFPCHEGTATPRLARLSPLFAASSLSLGTPRPSLPGWRSAIGDD